MKIKPILLGLLVAIITYLCFSFGQAEFNIVKWADNIRRLCAMLMGISLLVGVLFSSFINSDI